MDFKEVDIYIKDFQQYSNLNCHISYGKLFAEIEDLDDLTIQELDLNDLIFYQEYLFDLKDLTPFFPKLNEIITEKFTINFSASHLEFTYDNYRNGYNLRSFDIYSALNYKRDIEYLDKLLDLKNVLLKIDKTNFFTYNEKTLDHFNYCLSECSSTKTKELNRNIFYSLERIVRLSLEKNLVRFIKENS